MEARVGFFVKDRSFTGKFFSTALVKHYGFVVEKRPRQDRGRHSRGGSLPAIG
jgi:hypothetical protein